MKSTSENELNLDPILDELEENEKKQTNVNQNENENDIEWLDILNAIRSKNANFIKNLITSNQIAVNIQNPLTGKTVLIYAVIIGNMNLVKTVCDFGGDIHIKDDDGLDALDYAMKYGRDKITELVYHRELRSSLGNDISHDNYDCNCNICGQECNDFDFNICDSCQSQTEYNSTECMQLLKPKHQIQTQMNIDFMISLQDTHNAPYEKCNCMLDSPYNNHSVHNHTNICIVMIDTLFGQYFDQFERDNYFNAHGHGVFMQYILNQNLTSVSVEEQLGNGSKVENCLYVDAFDYSSFPLHHRALQYSVVMDQNVFKKLLFYILKYCYEKRMFPDLDAMYCFHLYYDIEMPKMWEDK
eukprot:848375_1